MNKDRFIGYVMFLLLIAASGTIVAVSIETLFARHQVRWINFGHIGDLRMQDDVKLRGVTVGTVSDIRLFGNRAFVQVELFHPIRLYRNYNLHASDSVVITADKGILGERIIHLDPGDSSQPEIPVEDTLIGIYYDGVSDVIGQAWRLRDLLRSYRIIADEYLHGSETERSFVDKYHTILSSIDSTTLWILNKTILLSNGVEDGVTTLNKLSDTVSAIVHTVDSATPPILKKTESAEHQVDSILSATDPIIATLDSLSNVIKASPLISDNPEADELRKKITDLKKNLEFLSSEAANLKLIFVR